MAKSEQLVRDIAKLFVKYNLDDWQLVLDMLKRGGPEYVEIAVAIEQLAKQHPSKQHPSKQHPSKQRSEKQPDDRAAALFSKVEGSRGVILREIFSNLKSKKLAPKLTDLRDVYIRTGGKERLSPRREDAIYELLAHMALLPEEVLASSVQELCERDRDLKNEYSRWFDIIYTKPA